MTMTMIRPSQVSETSVARNKRQRRARKVVGYYLFLLPATLFLVIYLVFGMTTCLYLNKAPDTTLDG